MPENSNFLEKSAFFIEMAENLDEILKNTDRYKNTFDVSRKNAEADVLMYTQCKEKAILGDENSRNFIINQYIRILKSGVLGVNDKNLPQLIDFENFQNNSKRVIFEMLLQLMDMSAIIDKYNIKIKFEEEELRQIVDSEKNGLIEMYKNKTARYKLLAILIYSKEYGQDCIDTLQHHNINEIGIIDKNYIYIVYKGEKLFIEFLEFDNPGIILNIQKKTTRNSVVNYDEQNPTLTASKLNSSRITVAGYESTPTDYELYYNERIFNLKKITMEELRDKYGTIDDLIYKFLQINQQGRGSHFITGSDMGVGKSTFLLAMMEMIPDKWGIGILDTQNELQARQKYPSKNIMTLIQNPKRTISDCFVTMLKMARDVLYVGEITMPGEVSELINASLRLNAGVGATMHSLSPFEIVTNVRNLMMRTDMYNNAGIAESDIARAIDIIIHLARHPFDSKRIIVESIVGIEPKDSGCVLLDSYGNPYHILLHQFNQNMEYQNLLNQDAVNYLRALYANFTECLYPKNYIIKEIIRYNPDKNRWDVINIPGDRYLKKLSRYVGANEINKLVSLLEQRMIHSFGTENGA